MSGVLKKIVALGIGGVLFYGGMLYERKKTTDLPYQITKQHGVYMMIDKTTNEAYEADKLVRVYNSAEDLVSIITGGTTHRKKNPLSELEGALK